MDGSVVRCWSRSRSSHRFQTLSLYPHGGCLFPRMGRSQSITCQRGRKRLCIYSTERRGVISSVWDKEPIPEAAEYLAANIFHLIAPFIEDTGLVSARLPLPLPVSESSSV